MSLICIPCSEPAVCLEGLDRYSLQDDLYSFVFNCPPGQFCGRNNFLFVLCCDGNRIRVDFTIGMSQDARDSKIKVAVADCESRRAFCQPGPPEPPTPGCPIPPCVVEYFYSAPATCTALCPDGTPFTYTVPAGVFLAKTYAEAQAAAAEYACAQVPLNMFCLPSLLACACLNTAFNAVLPASPSKPLKFLVVAGSFPAGLSIPVGVVANGVLRIQGTPTVTGNYLFTIRAIDANSNFIDKSYALQVVGITTSSLPQFTIGTPYSFQLVANGGSGNYVFGVASGTFPDGLGMNASGLITGTPTNLAVNSEIVFEVVDTACDEVNPRMFIPRASMTTVATTRTATVIGYQEFLQSSPPKKYKQADFSGAALEVILASATDAVIYSEHDLFSGTSLIDINGNVLSTHSRVVQGRDGDLAQPWYARGDMAYNSSGDNTGFIADFLYATTPDSTHKHVFSQEGSIDESDVPDPVYPAGSPLIGTIPINGLEYIANPYIFPPASGIYDAIPITTINTLIAKWIFFCWRFDYTVVLSNEYTDSDALSVAAISLSNSNVSRNEPRKVGFTSRYTTVAYTISLTNLVAGQVYRVTVPFHGDNGTNSSTVHTFTAISTIHSITGTAPTPPAWVSTEVRPPLVTFA